MSPVACRDRAIELLRRDPLRHIVGLKMLTLLGDQVAPCLVEGDGDWALCLSFPSDLSEYDAKTYGRGLRIAVLEGGLTEGHVALLEQLPKTDVLIKTHDPAVARYALERLGARPMTAFVSFTADERAPAAAVAATRAEASAPLTSSPDLRDEAREIFAKNGYGAAELERYFDGGAHCFAIPIGGTVVAACFVFRNYDAVWEIAGVNTDSRYRRRGLAARVVSAAVLHLLDAGLRPRYQTEASNLASLELARSVGLIEFLRIEHLLLPGASYRPAKV